MADEKRGRKFKSCLLYTSVSRDSDCALDPENVSGGTSGQKSANLSGQDFLLAPSSAGMARDNLLDPARPTRHPL
jgi:hypothetical protein